jgi:hypothetical protein
MYRAGRDSLLERLQVSNPVLIDPDAIIGTLERPHSDWNHTETLAFFLTAMPPQRRLGAQ